MQVGQVRVAFISDGSFWMDGGGAFGLVPRVLWAKYHPPDDQNRIQMVSRCLFLESQGKRILVNTGYGDKLSQVERERMRLERPEGGLLAELARLGVAPEDVDVVINTHLHGDHCGGNTRLVGGQPVPTFPRAEYWVQRLELADASFPNERTRGTYFPENFRPLEAHGQLRILWGDTWVTPEVRCQVAPGHTRANQVVIIESEGEKAIFFSDAAAMPIYLERLAWVPAYDLDPMQSIETKRNLARWAAHHRALCLFEHDPVHAAGYLREVEEGRFQFEPVATDE
ncbi:MAG: MBL fold metallo-hydrolase [Anaerolineae bacterium]|nr:MBL fold metallo-hydrolase [Anaerolineae bacterium]